MSEASDISMNGDEKGAFSRRRFLKAGLTSVTGVTLASAAALFLNDQTTAAISDKGIGGLAHTHGKTHPFSLGVTQDNAQGEMDPMKFLTAFDYGKVSTLPDGTTLREYELSAIDRLIQVAHGVYYPAWTYNGQVPGPTLRATEGDRLRIHFRNNGSHAHTIHFHGFHPANMDGVFEIVEPDGSYTYEFTAEPFGLHPYHCHVMPVKKHIEKGLYGTLIIDPDPPRPPAKELVMVMNGFDVNFDGTNEFYTVNGFANYFMEHPIKLKVNELVRVYLVNMTEFDLINSIHVHATFFKLYRTGTRLDDYEYTDTVILGQGERAILEFSYKSPGRFMFHAHQSEFQELGWNGMFEVEP